jgi:hypothetical protein
MEMAVNSVRNAALPLHQAASTYGVPYLTLQWRVKHEVEGPIRRGAKPVLNDDIETTMVAAVVALKKRGFGLSRKEVSLKETSINTINYLN